jgi:acetoin utilization deacetylase AcuC-like enzyme
MTTNVKEKDARQDEDASLLMSNDTNTTIVGLSACSKLGVHPSLNRFHAPIVYHEHYSFDDWPQHHTFPMDKFARLAECLTTNCRRINPEGSTLSRPVVRSYSDFFRPLDSIVDVPLGLWFEQPTGPIDPTFLNAFLEGTLTKEECRYVGFREQTPRPELIERTVLEVVGTILACQLALQFGIASNAAGGTHHATPTRGAGYTILNDLAIASNYLTNPFVHQGDVPSHIQKVLVIDCDVHQGDGTAKFGRNGTKNDESAVIAEGRMATLSLHCKDNYPHPKAHSTYDIGLAKNMGDEEYMQQLEQAVELALEEQQPDFVLYDAGVDIYEHDTLGRLKVSMEGMRQRDRFLLHSCVSRGIPVAAVIGGGYDKDVHALARRHAIVHEECAFQWRKHKMWQQALKKE